MPFSLEAHFENDDLPIRIMPEIIEKVENENRGKVSNKKYRVALKRFEQRFKIYR